MRCLKRVRGALLTALLVLVSLLTATAAVPEMPRFRVLDATSGLPSNVVRAMLQDAAGYLWLATSDGLARYDGTAFKVWRHDPNDPGSLPGDSVLALYIDVQDRIWVLSENAGLAVLDAQRRRFIQIPVGSVAKTDALHTLTGHGDAIWLSDLHASVIRIDSAGALTRYALADVSPTLKDTPVVALTFDTNGRLWVGTPDGLLYFEAGRLHLAPPPLDKASIHSIAAVGSRLWVGSTDGVYLQDAEGRWRAPNWGSMFAFGNLLLSVADAGDGEFWLGSERGLWRTRQERPPVQIPLSDMHHGVSTVSSLWRDMSGGLWVPVYGRGLGYLRQDWKRMAVVRPSDGGESAYCNVAPAAYSGGLWQLNRIGELMHLNTSTGELVHTGWQRHELRGMNITTTLEDSRGRLWLANMQNGLSRLDLKNGQWREWAAHGDDAVPLYGPISWIVEMPDSSLWLEALGVLQQRDLESGRVLNQIVPGSHGLDGSRVQQIGLGPDGRLWLAAGSGVYAWESQRRMFVPIPDLTGTRAYSFVPVGGNEVWVHRLRGLEQWRHSSHGWKRVALVGPQHGLPAMESLGMQHDAQGRIWLSTRRGLWRIDNTDELQVRNFGLRDGLGTQEFAEACLWMAPDGVLVGGTTDGYLMLFDTAMPDPAPFVPQLRMETVSVIRAGRRIDLPVDQPFELLPNDRQLIVGARLLSFGDPLSNRYSYWLKGFDTGWIDQGSSGTREFSSLPPADYTLLIQGTDPMGNLSRIHLVTFRVLPPWWRSAWGMSVLTGSGLLLLWGVAWNYHRRLRRRACLQLEQHQREVAERASLAKTQFLATLGHEVRTPMTGVLGMSELLLETPLDTRQHGYATSIQAAGKHLLRLVNDALDLAKIEAGKLSLERRDFDFHALLEQVVAMIRPMAERKGLRFVYRLDPEVPQYVHGDADRLQQILLNLLINATKFTEHGEVVLQVAPGQEQACLGVRIHVADTGPGLSEEQCQRLFRRFEQVNGASTAARYGGSGLGLAICRELATVMEGEIHVDSELGKGTCFRVLLPLPWVLAVQHAVAVMDAEPSPCSNPLHLLLIEDDPTVAEVIVELLRVRGHRVTHALHGLEALVEVTLTRFDACLCDLDLPGLDGAGLIVQLRAQGQFFPIVVVTARTDADAQRQALQVGCDAFLRKPVTGEMLEQVLTQVLSAPRQEADVDTPKKGMEWEGPGSVTR
ncbi:ligand-binding sensor domain-containing protein [Xylella fastidiosa]|uniref:ligand-binding sensor domain-containing protein n=1 Tax=Xylella fastidiosa TaxID=2371 RepID=UPI000765C2ED|nr:hybrid sensor histidine kinase/response regulator [Xylella fastidiosa]KXB13336.1 histidine kinase [Xylella fastidiosa]KXB22007.1 histidine kinase [Xylella fastidiosa]MDG5822026.1 ATP-binding protein [Xylella fastidiosa subsp. pauca]MDG5825579.1 ATP-binding protein [Xylella fastidiosa subsp. pauca]